MKSKNTIFKTLLSVCAGFVLIAFFMPLIQADFFVRISISIIDFFTNEGLEDIMEFGGSSDELSFYRAIFIIMVLLQILASTLLWVSKSKGKLALSIITGLYEAGLGFLLVMSFKENYAEAGSGLIFLIIAGLGQILISIIYLVKGENEKVTAYAGGGAGTSQSTTGETEGQQGGSILATVGEFEGASFPVGAEMIMLGRDSNSCSVILQGAGISRKHCGIKYDAVKRVYRVYDYSSNGTFLVEGAKLNPGENEVRPGSAIKIGNNEFLLQ